MNILITGGASGLGKSITILLAKEIEHTIYFTFNRSLAAAVELEEKYNNVKKIRCDFSDPTSLNSFCTDIASLDLDILVNNAFTGFEKKHFHRIEEIYFLQSFERNVVPVLKITQAAIKQFKKKKFGKIITILSSAIINKPPIGWSSYVANKSYLSSMSQSWATEYQKSNIVANCISPSFMLTNLNKDVDERIIEKMIVETPLKRLLTTEEVANAVLYLVNASSYINGTNQIINAGI